MQEAANQLLALRDSLRSSDDSTEQSQAHAKELLTLRDDLAANVEDTQIAHRHWASVRKLEADMKVAGGDIANAIETLELLTDLGTELRGQTQLLAGMRQMLAEFVMLESTIGRAMRVLEPLAQLKNLTRLSEAEVRAARVRFSNNAIRSSLTTTNCNPHRQPQNCQTTTTCSRTSLHPSSATVWFRRRVTSAGTTSRAPPVRTGAIE